MEINTLDILKNLAIILVAAKLLGIVARKLGAPQVVGEIIAGLIVGPCMLNFVSYDGFISGMAEIGVILLMFSAGLGTDLKELIKTGPVALLVAFAGVIVSVAGGAAVYLVFGFGDGDLAMLEAVFMGTILAATSVSITVQALKEMGHLKGRVATTILSAAIIDDVIGIVLLTVVTVSKAPMFSLRPFASTLYFSLFLHLYSALHFIFSSSGSTSSGRTQEESRFSVLFSALRVHIVRKNFSELQTSQAHMLQVLSSVTSRIHSTSKERWMSART